MKQEDELKFPPLTVSLFIESSQVVSSSTSTLQVALSASVLITNVDSVSAFIVVVPRKLQTDDLAIVRLFRKNTPSVCLHYQFSFQEWTYT
ncbi:unnamed protein product [Lactuca virosa]|uniref:Uncharacterized protein n=1 Tax=Lactuca virosa TaxID=75947 RepID=A0AAU9M2G3_9ASTR|nr:unnamed protein product [Lactuca virosa]